MGEDASLSYVSNSYSTASVSGGTSAYGGGLVGGNSGYASTSYSTGEVGGGQWTGGLAGTNGDSLTECFWDTTTSGQPYAIGAGNGVGSRVGGLDDTGMRQESNFTAAGGWYFTGGKYTEGNHWTMIDGVTYPFLAWQLTFSNLEAATYGYSSNAGIANSLNAILQRAATAQAAHQTSQMDALLRDYMKKVLGLSGRTFSALDDRLLLMEATLLL